MTSCCGLAERAGLDVADKPAASESIQRCIVTGFSDQLARRVDRGTLRCRLVHHRMGELARESAVRDADLLVAGEIREVQSRDELRVLLSQATAVQEGWLRELFPDDFSEGAETVFDPATRHVVTRKTRLFRDLVLDFTERDSTDTEAAARLLTEEVISGRCPLKNWDDAVEQWLVRLACLREWIPELELPRADEEARRTIIAQICHGSFTYKQIKDAAVWPALRDWLSPSSQRALDQFAPERFELPGGRKARIIYTYGQPPMTAARIQDLYGVQQLDGGEGPRAGDHPGARAEPTSRADHQRPREFLEGELPQDQAGALAEISKARVAVTNERSDGNTTNHGINEI